MNHDLNQSSTFLARGTLQRIDDGRGTWVQCLSGTLWLTQQNDARDIVLEAGDEAPHRAHGHQHRQCPERCARFVLLRTDPQVAAAVARNGAGLTLRPHA